MRVVLITGSRDWSDPGPVTAALDGADCLIVGDCPTGADRFAAKAARGRVKELRVHFAEWESNGKAAGPERNQRMVSLAMELKHRGHDVTVHAFPLRSSKGTWDCVKRARAAGLHVALHQPVPPTIARHARTGED